MTTDAKTDAGDGVNRLIDMVVEEVSLVDRAANKHRFLIVKRNDAMDDDNDQAEKASPEPTTTATPESETEDTEESEDSEEATKQDPPMAFADGSPLGAAVAALESLTAIVELLGSLGADRSDTRLAALAQQLRATAEQILERAGVAAGVPGDGDASAGGSTADGETADETASAKAEPANGDAAAAHSVFENDVMAAKQALARLADLAASAAPSSAEKRTEKRADAAGDSHAAPSTVESLAKLSESFRTLSTLVQDQQQRLGRVEKQFGLPNSAAPAEQVSKVAEADVGWPLDLNKPMDREHVDKAVSFHDL